ncbi:hypothetical protein ACLKMY_38970 [Paraburkholderia mimosarum]|uniref:hypothetical protein n=1 Tax=Paraburkholderia mimosarum TaxID=312026 RepID=UPI0039C4118F
MTVPEPEEYVDNCKSGFQAMFALMKPAVDGLHSAAVLNVQVARAALAGPANWQRGAAQQTEEMVTSYSRQLFEIATRTQTECAKVAQVQYERINKRVQESSAGVFSSAPADSGAPGEGGKSTFSTAADTLRTRRTRSPVATQDDIDAASAAVPQRATQEAVTRQR